MTIFDNCTTYILNNGNVLICYDNGCRLRKSLECSASTSFYQVEQQNLGRIYWRNKALKYLGLTISDIVCSCKGRIAFKD
jgi:hypothetical protein